MCCIFSDLNPESENSLISSPNLQTLCGSTMSPIQSVPVDKPLDMKHIKLPTCIIPGCLYLRNLIHLASDIIWLYQAVT
jgi:hypothetical protein